MALTSDEIAAIAELNRINGNSYLTDPNGLGDDGHRMNFVPGLHAMAKVLPAAAREAQSADMSAQIAAAQAAALSGASTTSVEIGVGSKTVTTQGGKAFAPGTFVLLTSDASPTTHYLGGQVTAYSGTSLTINVMTAVGGGSRADWTIRVAGAAGPTGNSGRVGPAPSLEIGTVTGGVSAHASIDGGDGEYSLNLTLPKGDRGDPGQRGDDGTSFAVDATGSFADRDSYDNEAAGFSFLDTGNGHLYLRETAAPGIWSPPIPFGKGERGDIGPQGPKGDKGDAGTAADTAAAIHSAPSKNSPVDADTLAAIDSEASNALTKVTWASIKSNLKTYFDPIYGGSGSLAPVSLPNLAALDMSTFVNAVVTVDTDVIIPNPVNAQPGQSGWIRVSISGTRAVSLASNWVRENVIFAAHPPYKTYTTIPDFGSFILRYTVISPGLVSFSVAALQFSVEYTVTPGSGIYQGQAIRGYSRIPDFGDFGAISPDDGFLSACIWQDNTPALIMVGAGFFSLVGWRVSVNGISSLLGEGNGGDIVDLPFPPPGSGTFTFTLTEP